MKGNAKTSRIECPNESPRERRAEKIYFKFYSDINAKILNFPQETWDPCSGRPTARAHEQWGYCQAGTSAALLPDK